MIDFVFNIIAKFEKLPLPEYLRVYFNVATFKLKILFFFGIFNNPSYKSE